MVTKEEELIKLAKDLVALLEDTTPHETSEAQAIVTKLAKLLGPNLAAIPQDLRKIIGVGYSSALVETEISTKAAYTRSALSLLRSAVKISHGPEQHVKQIDGYIISLENEISKCEASGEEALLDGLWKKENRAIDYMTFLLFNFGYGEILGKGFQFSKNEKPSTATEGGNK